LQGIFQDFLIWLLKFLAVSAGLLTAARIWTLHRRKKQASSDAGTPPSPPKPRQTSGESIPWWEDAAMARMSRSLLVCVVAAGAGFWLFHSPERTRGAWAGSVAGVLAIAGLCTLWLRHAQRRRIGLMEIRRLADDLELAALRLSPKSDLETALQTNVDQLESALSRVSIGLATQFRELAERTTIDAQALRTLADGVHQELSMQAAGQVRRVSKWGKYPLLAGALPAVCLLLVAPLTEWALDQITKTPAQQQDAKPQAARTAEPPPIKSVLLQNGPDASETVRRDEIALQTR
jgi:hypothetical protein